MESRRRLTPSQVLGTIIAGLALLTGGTSLAIGSFGPSSKAAVVPDSVLTTVTQVDSRVVRVTAIHGSSTDTLSVTTVTVSALKKEE